MTTNSCRSILARPPRMPPASLHHWLARLGLAAWLAVLLVAGSYLLAAHLLTLPKPDRDNPVFATAVAATPPADNGWRALHFLFVSCPCSNGVLEHLVTSERPSGVRERLVLIDDDGAWAAQGLAAGFEVETLTADALSGRGVGLAAVHDAVVAQGGTIEVCSRPNVGTTFRFAFPVPEDAVLVPRAAA